MTAWKRQAKKTDPKRLTRPLDTNEYIAINYSTNTLKYIPHARRTNLQKSQRAKTKDTNKRVFSSLHKDWFILDIFAWFGLCEKVSVVGPLVICIFLKSLCIRYQDETFGRKFHLLQGLTYLFLRKYFFDLGQTVLLKFFLLNWKEFNKTQIV